MEILGRLNSNSSDDGEPSELSDDWEEAVSASIYKQFTHDMKDVFTPEVEGQKDIVLNEERREHLVAYQLKMGEEDDEGMDEDSLCTHVIIALLIDDLLGQGRISYEDSMSFFEEQYDLFECSVTYEAVFASAWATVLIANKGPSEK